MISRVSGHAYPAGHGATRVARPLKTTRKSCLCANATSVLALVPKSAGLILNLSGGGKYGDHQRPCAHFDGSLANAFLTSARETPNCRAILDGVTPALKAARTAFSFPSVKLVGTSLVRCLREVSIVTGSVLPRRCCSAITAACNRSS